MECIKILLRAVSNEFQDVMIRLCYFFLVFVVANATAQEGSRINLKGRISFDGSVLEGITIVNLQSQQAVVSDKLGNFAILAKVSDTLLFAEGEFKEVRMGLSQKDLIQNILQVKMSPKINQLREVIVRNISAVSMGIIPQGQKKYSPAERKLYTATDLNASANVGSMMGGSISADPLLNWISGRTKLLKKELEVEKKESYLRQLDDWFTTDYYVNKLKIPFEYVKGFQYYSIENKALVAALIANNKTMTTFLIGDLAIKYKEIIASEN